MITMTVLLLAAQAQPAASYPIADGLAAKLVQKYNGSTCAELAQQRVAQPSAQKEAMKDRVGDALRNDAAMRADFVNKVAPTIVNKMIICGFIP